MRFRLSGVVLTTALLALFSIAASNVHGQGLTGQISGVVTDSSGGVIPGATVHIKNVGPTRPW